MSSDVEMLVKVGPPDTAEMTERFRNAGPCRAKMRREDFTVRRYVITSLCAMADGNHMVLFNVNARRHNTPPTAFEIFVDGRYVDRHLGQVINVQALRDEGGGLDLLGQVEGLLTGAAADEPELRVVRLRPLVIDADSVECPACGERKTATVRTADGVLGRLDCPACCGTGRLSPSDDTLPR